MKDVRKFFLESPCQHFCKVLHKGQGDVPFPNEKGVSSAHGCTIA